MKCMIDLCKKPIQYPWNESNLDVCSVNPKTPKHKKGASCCCKRKPKICTLQETNISFTVKARLESMTFRPSPGGILFSRSLEGTGFRRHPSTFCCFIWMPPHRRYFMGLRKGPNFTGEMGTSTRCCLTRVQVQCITWWVTQHMKIEKLWKTSFQQCGFRISPSSQILAGDKSGSGACKWRWQWEGLERKVCGTC